VGLEEEAIFFLLQRASPEHCLRSAFTRGTLQGWVYLEATMNPALIHLLKWTPGIIRTRQDLVCGEINPSDFMRLLTMTEPTCNLKEGEWAQVRKGLYKGDVGLVVAVENWGVEVLLPPRLNPPVSSSGLKRKRSH